MTAYILIIMAFSGGSYSHGNPAVSQQEFASKDACQHAASDITSVEGTRSWRDDDQLVVLCEAKS